MSNSASDFDPYYVWLGIPPKHQPADHYRLLGIERFEPDPRVIESAADRQMAHVKTFQTGKNSADSQRVLNHLAQARNCLLSPDEKAIYDQGLREDLAPLELAPLAASPPLPRAPQPANTSSILAPPSPRPPSAYAPILSAPKERATTFPWPAIVGAAGLAMAAVIGVVVVFVVVPQLTRQDPKTAQQVIPKSPILKPDPSMSGGPIHSPLRPENPGRRVDFGKPKPAISPPPPNPPLPSPLPPPTFPTVPMPPAVTPESTVPEPGPRSVATPPSEAPVPAGPPISLLEKLPPQPLTAGGMARGQWEFVDGQLVGKDGGFMFPGEVPQDYQLDITVEHLANAGFFVFGIVVGGHQTAVVVNWETGGNFVTGFHPLDGLGADRNETTFRGKVFQTGTPCQLRCLVRGNYVQISADGKSLIQWRGDPARLLVARDWAVPDPQALFISSSWTFRISRLELTPLVPSAPPPARLKPKFVLAAGRRLPPPTGKDLQQARIAAKKLYPKEFGLNSPTARRSLAQTLMTRLKEDRDEVAVRFALLYEAIELARSLSDPLLACDAIEEQGRLFELDTLELQTAAIEGIAKSHIGTTAAAILRNTAHAASIFLDKTLQAERLELATRLSAALTRLANFERSPELKEYSARRSGEVKFARQLSDVMKPLRGDVGEEPINAGPNLEVGRFECFVRGNWPEGLLLLSHGSDKELAEIATMELAADFRKYRALADAWWKLSESAEEPWQTQYRQQAKYWYEKVAAELSGLERSAKIGNVKGSARNRLAPGLVAAYYQGDNKDILRATRIEKRLYFPWGWGGGSPDPRTIPGDSYSAVWSGYLEAPIPGKYRLIVDSDDGSLLMLDGRILWDLFSSGAGVRSAEVDLTGQPQRLEVHYHEGVGVTHCVLRSELLGGSGERITDEVSLRHDPVAAREMHAKESIGYYPDLTAVPSAPEGGLLAIFEDQPEFPTMLTEGNGFAVLEKEDRYSGTSSLRISEDQRFRSGFPGVRARVRETPGPGEYRYLRLAWKKGGGKVIAFQILTESKPDARDKFFEWRRYHIGPSATFPLGGASIRVGEELPKDWSVITRDLFADYGEFDLTGVALSPCDGMYGLFDHIYLARRLEDFDRLGTPAASE